MLHYFTDKFKTIINAVKLQKQIYELNKIEINSTNNEIST